MPGGVGMGVCECVWWGGGKAALPHRAINAIRPPAYYPVPGQSLLITAPRYSALHLKLAFL